MYLTVPVWFLEDSLSSETELSVKYNICQASPQWPPSSQSHIEATHQSWWQRYILCCHAYACLEWQVVGVWGLGRKDGIHRTPASHLREIFLLIPLSLISKFSQKGGVQLGNARQGSQPLLFMSEIPTTSSPAGGEIIGGHGTSKSGA